MKTVILVKEERKELALQPWAADWQQQHGGRTVEKPFTGLNSVVRLPILYVRAYLFGLKFLGSIMNSCYNW